MENDNDVSILLEKMQQELAEKNREIDRLKTRMLFLEAVADSSTEGLLVIDSEGRIILQNRRTVELWKMPKNIQDNVDGNEQVQHVMHMTKNPEQFVREIEIQKKHPEQVNRDELELVDGTILERYSSPVIGGNGQHYGRVYSFHDITAMKQNEKKINSLLDEKELFLKEVHHRIKNNMNSILSLLMLQASTINQAETKGAFNDAVSRIQTMMILYDKLYQSEDYNVMPVNSYLNTLIDQIMRGFPEYGSVVLEKNIGSFTLEQKKLQPLGIIINELLTNIMKYAFPDRNDGKILIDVTLQPGSGEAADTVSVVVRDDGKGMPESVDFEKSTGFGMTLVGILCQQLRGKVRIEREKGTAVFLEFMR